MRQRKRAGFTLIELMIVVAIIGILSLIALPRFAQLVRKSKEGATKGRLGALRSALMIYYGDSPGFFPDDPTSLVPAYLDKFSEAGVPSYHPDSSAITYGTLPAAISDAGGWAYDNNTSSDFNGKILVNCLHTDSKGGEWSSY